MFLELQPNSGIPLLDEKDKMLAYKGLLKSYLDLTGLPKARAIRELAEPVERGIHPHLLDALRIRYVVASITKK